MSEKRERRDFLSTKERKTLADLKATNLFDFFRHRTQIVELGGQVYPYLRQAEGVVGADKAAEVRTMFAACMESLSGGDELIKKIDGDLHWTETVDSEVDESEKKPKKIKSVFTKDILFDVSNLQNQSFLQSDQAYKDTLFDRAKDIATWAKKHEETVQVVGEANEQLITVEANLKKLSEYLNWCELATIQPDDTEKVKKNKERLLISLNVISLESETESGEWEIAREAAKKIESSSSSEEEKNRLNFLKMKVESGAQELLALVFTYRRINGDSADNTKLSELDLAVTHFEKVSSGAAQEIDLLQDNLDKENLDLSVLEKEIQDSILKARSEVVRLLGTHFPASKGKMSRADIINQPIEKQKEDFEAKMIELERLFAGDRFFGPKQLKELMGFDLELGDIPPIPYSDETLAEFEKKGGNLVLFVDKDPEGKPLSAEHLGKIMNPRIKKAQLLIGESVKKMDRFKNLFSLDAYPLPTRDFSSKVEMIPKSSDQSWLAGEDAYRNEPPELAWKVIFDGGHTSSQVSILERFRGIANNFEDKGSEAKKEFEAMPLEEYGKVLKGGNKAAISEVTKNLLNTRVANKHLLTLSEAVYYSSLKIASGAKNKNNYNQQNCKKLLFGGVGNVGSTVLKNHSNEGESMVIGFDIENTKLNLVVKTPDENGQVVFHDPYDQKKSTSQFTINLFTA